MNEQLTRREALASALAAAALGGGALLRPASARAAAAGTARIGVILPLSKPALAVVALVGASDAHADVFGTISLVSASPFGQASGVRTGKCPRRSAPSYGR